MSFDVLRDGDGGGREQFPLSMLLCAGTQADTALSNRYEPPVNVNRIDALCFGKALMHLM